MTNVDQLSETCKPLRLFQICLKFVADHLDLVESLHGFPALIGEKIFRLGIESSRWLDGLEYQRQVLPLFTDAFEEDMLSSLNMSGKYLALNYSLEQLLLFEHLRELDISRCGIGDDLEILSHFQRLTSLEVLCLSHNAITNAGIRKMTTPYRMYHRGPAGLRAVSVQGNDGMDARCCKNFSAFPELKQIAFSDIKPRKDVQSWLPGWDIEPADSATIQSTVVTSGWARVLVDRWITEAENKSQQKLKNMTQSKPYSRNRLKQAAAVKSLPEVQDSRTTYVARRELRNVTNRLTSSNQTSIENSSLGSSDETKPQESENGFDSNIMGIYLNTDSGKRNATAHNVLSQLDDAETSENDTLNGELVNEGRSDAPKSLSAILKEKSYSNVWNKNYNAISSKCTCQADRKEVRSVNKLSGNNSSGKMSVSNSQMRITDFSRCPDCERRLMETERKDKDKKMKLINFPKKPQLSNPVQDSESLFSTGLSSHKRKKVKLIKSTKRPFHSSEEASCQRETKCPKLDTGLLTKQSSALYDALDEYN